MDSSKKKKRKTDERFDFCRVTYMWGFVFD
jgi:hypothetical protein